MSDAKRLAPCVVIWRVHKGFKSLAPEIKKKRFPRSMISDQIAYKTYMCNRAPFPTQTFFNFGRQGFETCIHMPNVDFLSTQCNGSGRCKFVVNACIKLLARPLELEIFANPTEPAYARESMDSIVYEGGF